MSRHAASRPVLLDTSLQEYFHDSITSALSRQTVRAAPETVAYLVNLLVSFVRTERLYEPSDDGLTLRPLAVLYAETLQAPDAGARQRLLRRLGDVALFIAGVFTDSLKRKVVDVDYYIALGGNAYARLSDTLGPAVGARSLRAVFEELAGKFTDFVDVLGEVGAGGPLDNHEDVLRLYEVWLRTGSRRAAARLRALGLVPSPAFTSRASH
jgi:hypothetical protein